MSGKWYHTKPLSVRWLVDGLLANDSTSAFFGKPKAGKSTALRSLVASVIKGRPFLGRKVFVPQEGGRVLYLHLDRKDPVELVAEELRTLGITEQESKNLDLISAVEMPEDVDERRGWLYEKVVTFKPHLVVIDLLFQFVTTDNTNDYSKNIKAINELQDGFREHGFFGHLTTAHHARKAVNYEEPFDDFLGSTGVRASVSTGVCFRRDRESKRYSLISDQTYRAKEYGEIDETVVHRDPITGEIFLGSEVAKLKEAQHVAKEMNDTQRILSYVAEHTGCTQMEIVEGLGIHKSRLLRLLEENKHQIQRSGFGRATNPYTYSIAVPSEDEQPVGAMSGGERC